MATEGIISFDMKGFDALRSSIRKSVDALPETIRTELLAGVQQGAVELGVETIMQFTPVRTHRLQRSTQGFIEVRDDGVAVVFIQPAENDQGVQYAPFVILGHHTVSGSLVPPDPYPQEAWDQMKGPMNSLLREAAQRIAEKTAQIMGRVA